MYGKSASDMGKQNEASLHEMTVVGSVEEIVKHKKDGTEAKPMFRLTDTDGIDVYLPKGEIEQYVGIKVKVTCQGVVFQRKGIPVKYIKTITKIEKWDDPDLSNVAGAEVRNKNQDTNRLPVTR